MNDLKAPFSYFGGKSSVAAMVWQFLGNPVRYIEPFFGSGAVLLARPNWRDARYEIVNDKDGYVANVWRSLQFQPDEVARWCDWPVNHADLAARRRVLIREHDKLLSRLVDDPDYCDPVLAGYWIWAAGCWIGHGLTTNQSGTGQIPELHHSRGVHQIGKRPHLSWNMGTHNVIRRETNQSDDVTAPYNLGIYHWFRQLSERLRYVKVVCGDWTRVCGGDWQGDQGICGIFFDPPYSHLADREAGLYHVEDLDVALDVAKWAAERGKKPSYRIVLAGYQGEHEWLAEHGWRAYYWQAQGGYSNQGAAKDNKKREILWISPHCVGQRMLL